MERILSQAGPPSLKRTLAAFGKWLFEPSPDLIDVTARRRARLLAMLLLPNSLHLIASAIAVHATETGVLAERVPVVMSAALPFFLVAYALSRTRYARQAGWLYILTALLIPTAILVTTGPSGATSPWNTAPFLIPPVLLASVIEPVIVTLLAGVFALSALALVTYLMDVPSWAGELRHSSIVLTVITLLTAIFAVYRDKLEGDRSAELQSRNLELEALKTSLEDRVRERTAELSARNDEMRLVFDNIAEGLFLVDDKGYLSNEHSAALARWFGPVRPDEQFFHYFGRHSAAFGASAELAWQQLVDGFFDAEIALDQMPTTLVTDGRTYRLSYQLIGSGEHGKFLAFVVDATSQIERENLQREKRETLALFECMLSDRVGFTQFMEEDAELVALVLAGKLDRAERSRAIHTLKGNCMLFGLESVGELCHQIESHIADGHDEAFMADLAKLEQRWKRLEDDFEKLLGGRAEVIELSPEEHVLLERAVEQAPSRAAILDLIRDLKLEPVERRFRRCAEQVRAIGVRLGRQLEVEVAGGGIRLDTKSWSPVWTAFVHLLRNAVDHGIEPPEQRRTSGKPEIGRIALRARRDPASISISVEDDGRGIDWEAVRRGCEARGLPCGSHDELVAGLFTDGLSTAERVTELSGRGVGMSALQSAVQALGGDISVQSEPRRGARFTLRFPASEGRSARAAIGDAN